MTRPGGLRKNELVAAKIAGLRPHLLQHKAPLFEEIEDLLRLGDFEGIPSDPIEQVTPRRHASLAPVFTPALERLQSEQIFEPAPPPQSDADRQSQQESHRTGGAVIETFHSRPAHAGRAQVVIDGYEECSTVADKWCHISQRLPHCARVVQHAPGINDVEGPQQTDILRVESRAFFDLPTRISREIPL